MQTIAYIHLQYFRIPIQILIFFTLKSYLQKCKLKLAITMSVFKLLKFKF